MSTHVKWMVEYSNIDFADRKKPLLLQRARFRDVHLYIFTMQIVDDV